MAQTQHKGLLAKLLQQIKHKPLPWLIGVALTLAAAISINNMTSQTVMIPYQNAQAVAQGQEIYQQACASCHGVQLQGQANWKTRLPNGMMPAPPHSVEGHTWHHPDALLFKMTKFGTASIAPPGYVSAMPAFEDSLSDEEILAVLAYIKSTWPAAVQQRHSQMSAH
ncbi:MAG: c-type cytochrome [Pontibacterium sp.]